MNNAIKAGEVFKLAELLPYQEGKIIKRELFQAKTHCLKCSISESPNSTKSGMAARFRTGLWSETNSLQMTKSKPVLRNTST